MTKSQKITDGLAEFAATHKQGFTAAQVAEHFGTSEALAVKVLRGVEGLKFTKVDDLVTFMFGEVKAKRNIKTAPDERRAKVTAYLKAACYNAEKISMTEGELRAELDLMVSRYDIESDEPAQLDSMSDEPAQLDSMSDSDAVVTQ